MSKILPIFRGSSGLNNRIDPRRIQYDAKTGVMDQSELLDVDVDNSLRLSRRKGNLRVVSVLPGGVHSLWGDGRDCFCVSGSTLFKVNANYTNTALAAVMPGIEVGYGRINDIVVWGNGVETGLIRDDVNHPWVRPVNRPHPPYVDQNTTAEYSDPPVGTMFELWNGRIYVIVGNTAYASDNKQYSYFRMAENRLVFPHNITMFKGIADGIYISTDYSGETWFARGDGLNSLKRIELETSLGPVIPGSVQLIDASSVSGGKVIGSAVMWTSPHGICVGMAQGVAFNLTRNKLVYPMGNKACSSYVDGVYRVFFSP